MGKILNRDYDLGANGKANKQSPIADGTKKRYAGRQQGEENEFEKYQEEDGYCVSGPSSPLMNSYDVNHDFSGHTSMWHSKQLQQEFLGPAPSFGPVKYDNYLASLDKAGTDSSSNETVTVSISDDAPISWA